MRFQKNYKFCVPQQISDACKWMPPNVFLCPNNNEGRRLPTLVCYQAVIQELARVAAMAQQASRDRPGLLAVLHDAFAVDHDDLIALGTPRRCGAIRRLGSRARLPPAGPSDLQVVDDDRPPPDCLPDRARAAISEAGAHRRYCATQTEMQPLRAASMSVLAHEVDQRLGRVTAAGEELGMRTAIRYAEDRHASLR